MPISPDATAALERRLGALEATALEPLRVEWRRVVKTQPQHRLSADLLRRGIAHRLQEATYGGLPKPIFRKLAAAAASGGIAVAVPTAVTLKPGTSLVREWHGRTHTVRVLASGFDYDGRRYASLTKIAHEITGAAWSGPRFFGVQNAGTAFRAQARSSDA